MVDTNYDPRFACGILTHSREGAELPPEDLWNIKKNGLVVVECPQRIPCNPCHTSCPTAAIVAFDDINDVPRVDYAKCTGCGLCVAVCPGLACFVIDMTWAEDRALMKLPYEFLPKAQKGQMAVLLDREGTDVGRGLVVRVVEPHKDRTFVVHVEVPKALVNDVRAIRIEE